MTEERETKENTPSLEDNLVQELRDWIKRMAPRVQGAHWPERSASIKFEIFGGETAYLDDDTPYVEARVTEESQLSEAGGWIPEVSNGD